MHHTLLPGLVTEIFNEPPGCNKLNMKNKQGHSKQPGVGSVHSATSCREMQSLSTAVSNCNFFKQFSN